MTEATFEVQKGDGGPMPELRGAPTLEQLQEEIELIVRDADKGLSIANVDAAAIRRCEWAGQTPDARKHAEASNSTMPEPFEGATDGRYRIADMVTNEDVMLCVLATQRARVKVLGREPGDDSYAANMTLVLQYVLDKMGHEWLREVIKLAQYVNGDSPAVGLMSVYWREERELELKRMTSEDILAFYLDAVAEGLDPSDPAALEQMAAASAAAGQFVTDLLDPEIPEDAFVAMLRQFFPSLSDSRAKKVVRQLRQSDMAEFPVPVVRVSLPWVCAKRFMQDFWLANNTQDFQRCRVWYETEWLTHAEVEERAAVQGWRRAFVDDVLKHEGVAAFPEYEKNADGKVLRYGADRYRGLFQIVHAYFRAVNSDGIMGRYRLTFHHMVNVDARGVELLDYPHGKYPGHFFRREVLNNRELDSRGLPELTGPHQSLIKLFGDSAGDNGQLAGVPPIITRGRRNQGDLYIAPMVELPAKRDGDYAWMSVPQYPQTIFELVKRLQAEIDQYHGRSTPNVDPELKALHRQFKAMTWLANIGEVYRQIIQMCQAWMPDEVLRRITNADGLAVMNSREDIRGEFDIKLLFDPMDMDPEYIRTVGEFVKNVLLTMDRNKRINVDEVVMSLFYRIAPDLAERAVKSRDRADADEIKAEFDNYVKILGGVEPERVTDGSINYELRAAMYRDIQAKNPAAFSSLPADRQQILTAHVEHLEAMAEQFGANVQIGREGARRALEQGESVAARV